MPDSRTSGSAEIEQAVFGDRAEMKSFQAPSQADIPEEIWKNADALMIWGGGWGADPQDGDAGGGRCCSRDRGEEGATTLALKGETSYLRGMLQRCAVSAHRGSVQCSNGRCLP